jgi:hypothetical protein
MDESEDEDSDLEAACLEYAEMILEAIKADDAKKLHEYFAEYHTLLHKKYDDEDSGEYGSSDY